MYLCMSEIWNISCIWWHVSIWLAGLFSFCEWYDLKNSVVELLSHTSLKCLKWLLNSLFVISGNIKIIKQNGSLTGMAGFWFIFFYFLFFCYAAKVDLELNHYSACLELTMIWYHGKSGIIKRGLVVVFLFPFYRAFWGMLMLCLP